MDRVRACEDRRRAIETRYFALPQRKRRWIVLGYYGFSDKSTERVLYFFGYVIL